MEGKVFQGWVWKGRRVKGSWVRVCEDYHCNWPGSFLNMRSDTRVGSRRGGVSKGSEAPTKEPPSIEQASEA